MTYSTSEARYPYTYAYDWLRQAGVAESRADAADWVRRVCEATGQTKEDICVKAAGEYMHYWNAVTDLDIEKSEQFSGWLKMHIPKPLNGLPADGSKAIE